VSGNWRLVFEFDGEDATNVDLIDCHEENDLLGQCPT